jgi:tetratricopeptide (TPR) repeat protein
MGGSPMIRCAVVLCFLVAIGSGDAPTPQEKSTYEAAAAKAGRDALAHIRLASWCEIHGMQVERHKHLGIALELAPDHPAIHGLLGEVADNGQWRMAQAVAEDYRTDAGVKATLENYRARRDKSPDTAQAHWQLAEWCQENGLKAEAKAHLRAVIRLNPSREDAWKKLGFHKAKGQWTTTELASAGHDEAERQRKADGHWRPLLEKWKNGLARKSKREESDAALVKLQDARAVPSIWRVFGLSGPADQERAVRLLSQIDAPSASRALASLAVMGLTEGVRAHAADALLKRDPREFAGVLIGAIRDPIEFEVREVEGPGKPGELYVHGKRMNRRFFYEAPPPLATLRPSDIVGYDYNGLPVANRVVGYAYEPVAAAVNPLFMGGPDLSNAPQVLGHVFGQAGTALGQRMVKNQQDSINAGNIIPQGGFMMPLTFPIPVGQLKIQAEQKAANSKAQLLEDVASLDRYNSDVNGMNTRATEALTATLLENHGPKREDWVKWWSGLIETSTDLAPRPRDRDRQGETSANGISKRAMLPGLAAGTPVWTLSGLNAIESLRTGDQVLTQDTDSGALTYRPVLAIHDATRQPIKTIGLGNVSIDATQLERFWRAGKGWVMAGDLKPGDLVRSMSGLRRVTKIEDAKPQGIYHVQVGEGRGILVGQFGVLAHDEQVGRPVVSPFDNAAIEGSKPTL